MSKITMTTKTLKQNLTKLATNKRTKLYLFIAAFATIGIVALLATKAATPFASIEPETGTLSRTDLSVNDTSASGGRAVQFKAATTGQLNCASQPSRCGFADETNTGILAGVTLTKVPSQATSGAGWACVPSTTSCTGITITGNVGTATTGLELADGLEAAIDVSNVTVRNLKLLGVHGQSSDGIWVGPTTNNVKIEYCDLTGAADNAGTDTPTRGWSGIHIKNGASNYTVNYCHIRGFSGPIFFEQEEGTVTFIGNYIHHIVDYGPWADHCNVYGNGGGPDDLTSKQIIKDNTLWGDHPSCMSSTISLFPDGNTQTNQHTVIEHNLLSSGGYYCINPGYGNAYGSAGRSYIAFKDNHWSTRNNPGCGYNGISYVYPLDASSGQGNYQCGNIWDDGPLAGSGADQDNYYPSSMKPVTTCPSPAPW
jgi:hypothetical protein